VRRDHRSVPAAVPTLPDLAVTVDQEVVTDVAPSIGVRVEVVHAADQRGDVAGSIAVRVDRVVDDGEVDRRCVVRRRAARIQVAESFVRAPHRARRDERRSNLRVGNGCTERGADETAASRALDVEGMQLDADGRTDVEANLECSDVVSDPGWTG
jgi:hypothetical protein